ncbi:antitoxin [Caulobacter sp. LARHSG274]
MADGEITLKIDAALADSLRARAEEAGQSVEAYAYSVLEHGFVERPGFEDGNAHWDEVQRIADETERDGGIPLEDVQRWVASWDTDNELPPPEPRPRNAE